MAARGGFSVLRLWDRAARGMDGDAEARRATRLLSPTAVSPGRGTPSQSNCSPVHVLRRRLPDRIAASAAFGRRSPTGMERCDIGLWLRRSGGVAREDARAGRAQLPRGAQGSAGGTARDRGFLEAAPADCATQLA